MRIIIRIFRLILLDGLIFGEEIFFLFFNGKDFFFDYYG